MSFNGRDANAFLDAKIQERFGKRGSDITADEMIADLVSEGRSSRVN